LKRKKRLVIVIAAMIAITGLTGIWSIFAVSSAPNLSIAITSANFAGTSGFDTLLYVNTPAATSNTLARYFLSSAFIVQTIDDQFTAPDGTVSTDHLITCVTSPDYPSRGAVTTCTGFFTQRVESRAYSGSTTGIYFIGYVGFTPPGHWILTDTATGLFQGATITLTATVQFNVVDVTPGPITPQ
jgi:hypothetical protein